MSWLLVPDRRREVGALWGHQTPYLLGVSEGVSVQDAGHEEDDTEERLDSLQGGTLRYRQEEEGRSGGGGGGQ